MDTCSRLLERERKDGEKFCYFVFFVSATRSWIIDFHNAFRWKLRDASQPVTTSKFKQRIKFNWRNCTTHWIPHHRNINKTDLHQHFPVGKFFAFQSGFAFAFSFSQIAQETAKRECKIENKKKKRFCLNVWNDEWTRMEFARSQWWIFFHSLVDNHHHQLLLLHRDFICCILNFKPLIEDFFSFSFFDGRFKADAFVEFPNLESIWNAAQANAIKTQKHQNLVKNAMANEMRRRRRRKNACMLMRWTTKRCEQRTWRKKRFLERTKTRKNKRGK